MNRILCLIVAIALGCLLPLAFSHMDREYADFVETTLKLAQSHPHLNSQEIAQKMGPFKGSFLLSFTMALASLLLCALSTYLFFNPERADRLLGQEG